MSQSRFERAIPETGRNRRHNSRNVNQDSISHKTQFGQAETGRIGKDELTMETHHLFCGQRRLFHRPAITADMMPCGLTCTGTSRASTA